MLSFNKKDKNKFIGVKPAPRHASEGVTTMSLPENTLATFYKCKVENGKWKVVLIFSKACSAKKTNPCHCEPVRAWQSSYLLTDFVETKIQNNICQCKVESGKWKVKEVVNG